MTNVICTCSCYSFQSSCLRDNLAPPWALSDTLYAVACHEFFSSTILMSMNAVTHQQIGLEGSWQQDQSGGLLSMQKAQAQKLTVSPPVVLISTTWEQHRSRCPSLACTCLFYMLKWVLIFFYFPFFSLLFPPLPLHLLLSPSFCLFLCFYISLTLYKLIFQ